MSDAAKTKVEGMFDFSSAQTTVAKLEVWARGENHRNALTDHLRQSLTSIIYDLAVEIQRTSGETADAILSQLIYSRGEELLTHLTGGEVDESTRLDAKKYAMTGNNNFANYIKVCSATFSFGGRFGDGKDEIQTISKAKSFNTTQETLKIEREKENELKSAVEAQLIQQGLKPGSEEFKQAMDSKLKALKGGKKDEPVAVAKPDDFITREVAKLEAVLRAMHADLGASEADVIGMVDGQIEMWRKNVAMSLMSIGKKSGFIVTDDVKQVG